MCVCVSLSECSLALDFFGQVVMIANIFARLAKFLVERKASSVVAHVFWRFTRWSVTNVCSQVGFSLEASRCGFHCARPDKSFSCRVERFEFPVFVEFRFGRYVIRCVLLSVLSPVWSVCCERVQAMSKNVGRRFQRRSATMCITKFAWRGRDVVARFFGV